MLYAPFEGQGDGAGHPCQSRMAPRCSSFPGEVLGGGHEMARGKLLPVPQGLFAGETTGSTMLASTPALLQKLGALSSGRW